jgi:hypothetical protein
MMHRAGLLGGLAPPHPAESLAVPPEEPKLSCFRKNPLVNAICEWRPSSTPSPTTKAVLFAKKM